MLNLLQVNRVMCETGIFVLPDEHPDDIFPHNIVVFGDVGVNADMTPEPSPAWPWAPAPWPATSSPRTCCR